jgi:hypothetical protein
MLDGLSFDTMRLPFCFCPSTVRFGGAGGHLSRTTTPLSRTTSLLSRTTISLSRTTISLSRTTFVTGIVRLDEMASVRVGSLLFDDHSRSCPRQPVAPRPSEGAAALKGEVHVQVGW